MLRPGSILTAALLSLVVQTASAQEELPAAVKFGDGEISFARGEDEEIAVTVNGQEIYRNYFVTFERLAKVGGTDVALLLGGPGGNACGPSSLIVTQPEGSPDAKVDIVGEDCGAPPVTVMPHEIRFVPYLVPGATETVQKWTPDGGLAEAEEISYQPQEGSNWDSLDPAKADHPYALLNNADIYAAAQNLTGDKFSELVTLLGVAGPPEVLDGGLVASPGCQAHACGTANGFLGLDLENSQVFAATKYSNADAALWPADISAWPSPLRQAFEASVAP